jgi:hypothetical protein
MPDKKFTVEYQYQLFLERMNLHEDRMHPQQKLQLKQAFYGAVSQFLFLVQDDMAELEQDKILEVFSGMMGELSDYWNSYEIKPLN